MKVQVTLAGRNGIRNTTVNARRFTTRHVRTRPVPVAKPVINPVAKPTTDLAALLAKVDRIMGIQ